MTYNILTLSIMTLCLTALIIITLRYNDNVVVMNVVAPFKIETPFYVFLQPGANVIKLFVSYLRIFELS
jgi:hypothetical protein